MAEHSVSSLQKKQSKKEEGQHGLPADQGNVRSPTALCMSRVGELLLLFLLLHSRGLHMVPMANSSVGSAVVLTVLSKKPDIGQKVLEMTFAVVLHGGEKPHSATLYQKCLVG